VRTAGVLTAENCTLNVYRFIIAAARTRNSWKLSPMKGEIELLNMCCNWLSAGKIIQTLTETALSALILDLLPTAELYHRLMCWSIPVQFIPSLKIGGDVYPFGRQEVKEFASELKRPSVGKTKPQKSFKLEHVQFFGHEVHVACCRWIRQI
jgi:hypothetical protein